MKIVVSLFAVALILLGIIFAIAAMPNQHLNAGFNAGRLIIGVVLMGGGGLLVYLAQMRPTIEQVTVQHTLDAPGELKIKEMRCKQCSGALSRDNMKVSEGGITVTCPYCGSTYQIEEAPKW